jgi:hypothetical protein
LLEKKKILFFSKNVFKKPGEEISRVVEISQIGQTTLRQQAKAIEHLKDFARRLMNGTNYCLALLGKTPHALGNVNGHVGVEARCGLVAEQNRRVGKNLGSERKPTLFSSRNAFTLKNKCF